MADRSARQVTVPGSVWFGAMVAVWAIFFTLLVVQPETLEGVYDWLRDLATLWEVLMWIVLLPWAVAWVIWESSWDHWVRVLCVVLLCALHLAISVPRLRR
jgi:hypothetical protein